MTKYLYKSIESLENHDETMPNWYKPKIDAKLLKKLSKRSNGPAWINTILYFGVLLFSGASPNRLIDCAMKFCINIPVKSF